MKPYRYNIKLIENEKWKDHHPGLITEEQPQYLIHESSPSIEVERKWIIINIQTGKTPFTRFKKGEATGAGVISAELSRNGFGKLLKLLT